MTIVSAFLVPGSPLPHLRSDVESWNKFKLAMENVGQALRASKPDVVLIYSTQWFAVLDEIWLTRKRSTDVHVDENWHEFGELPYDIHSDVELANACIDACRSAGVNARGADYESFPIDTGTIVACNALRIGTPDLPVVVASNNLYDDPAATRKLAGLAVSRLSEKGKRVAIVGVGGLSGSVFTTTIEPSDDHIVKETEDEWNLKVLNLIQEGSNGELLEVLKTYAKEARVEMGFKHFHWLLGALGEHFKGANVHHYGAIYGSGAAVVELLI
ncbi:tRNA U-34 5-methylaminomethyl-2-thiouridine biosynthesis protein [Enterobacterales bacterium BD_CKDN230030183-1A_HGKHYDSX7]